MESGAQGHHFMVPGAKNQLRASWSLPRIKHRSRAAKAAPGYKSLIEMSIGEKVGVIVLLNGYDADPLLYVNQAFTIVAPALQKAAERPKATPNADPAWSKYVATYSWKHVDPKSW